jgi:predicted nucleic acid-binding Zn ribbon protein
MQQSSPGVAVLEIRGPHVVLAKYRAEHYVSVKGPQGVIYAGWVGEGDELKLTAPEHIQLGQDVRLRFAGWSGLEGLRSPEISLKVLEPVQAEVLYVKQYLLSVSSPVGAGGAGWYDEGSKAIVTVPENPPANVFIKRRLSGFSGDCGECVHNKGVLTVTMDKPRSIAAAYTSEPDFMNLGILAGVVFAGGAAYVAGRRRPEDKTRGGESGGTAPVCRVCGSEIPADTIFCPFCGVRLKETRIRKGGGLGVEVKAPQL